jgi:cell division protein FtsL
MAPRKVAGSRRRPSATLLLVLLGFLVVTTGVIWRRSEGLARAREQATLQQRREALVAEQRRLETEVRDASSRRRLAPIAEQRLGMRVPPANQLIYLPRPRAVTPADDPQ